MGVNFSLTDIVADIFSKKEKFSFFFYYYYIIYFFFFKGKNRRKVVSFLNSTAARWLMFSGQVSDIHKYTHSAGKGRKMHTCRYYGNIFPTRQVISFFFLKRKLI